MNAKLFINFTNRDFVCKWDGQDWNFKAGDKMMLQDYLADHFAKHLVDREMTRLGKPVNAEPKRSELLALCLGNTNIESDNEESLSAKILNAKAEEPEEIEEEKEEEPQENLDDEQFEGLEEDLVNKYSSKPVGEVSLEELSYDEVKAIAKEKGIKLNQSKEKLIKEINKQ